MVKQTTEMFAAVNPLVGLSSKAIRLYNALEVFQTQNRECCPDGPEWFQVSQRERILRRAGFSKIEIDKAITELLDANLLQIQDKENIKWYCLK